jgi:hypothetical protein
MPRIKRWVAITIGGLDLVQKLLFMRIRFSLMGVIKRLMSGGIKG